MSSFFALIIFYECSPRAKIVALLPLSLCLSSLWPAAVAFLFSFPFSLSFSRFVLRALIFFGFFVSAFFREPAVLFSWSVPIFGLIIVLLIVVGLAQVFCSTSLCKTQSLLGNASRARHAL